MSLSAEKPILKMEVHSRPVVVDPYNRRLKLVGWSADDVALVSMRDVRSCSPEAASATKAIVYARRAQKTPFETLGFNYEAVIYGYFADGANAHLYSCFFDARRGRLDPKERAHETVRRARTKSPFANSLRVSSRSAQPEDARAISTFLQGAFQDYPTPIDAESLGRAIDEESTIFRLCTDEGRIVACASAEIDHENQCAEISDCATDPDYRGRGIVSQLISEVEYEAGASHGIRDFYSLARAGEVGMNCAVAKCGYHYTGRLVNNCRMPNGWESIHVWCRCLDG